MSSNIILVSILAVAILGKANSIAIATSALLIIKLAGAAALLGGVPVGPLITSGLLVFIVKVVEFIHK